MFEYHASCIMPIPLAICNNDHVRVKTRWRYIFELGEIRWIVCSIAPALPISSTPSALHNGQVLWVEVHLCAGGDQVDRLLYHPSSVDFLNDPQIHCSAFQVQIIMYTMPIVVGSFGRKCIHSTQKGSCVIYLSQHHLSSYIVSFGNTC